MKAYVMSAGVGSRLEPLTLAVPKPLVPICNIPVMQYNISLLKNYGIKDITANLHYFPEQIEDYFKDGHDFGVIINYSYEKKLLGTAGGVKVMAAINPPTGNFFIVLSSDVLMDMDLDRLINFHKKNKSLATIALIKVDDPSEYGVVATNKNKIVAFQEKPSREQAISNLINTGVYMFDKKILSLIPKNMFYDFGRNLFPLLVEKKLPFYGFEMDSYWKDIGNPKNYVSANFDVLSNKVKIPFKIAKNGKGSKINSKSKISKGAMIGNNCIIEENALIIGKVVIGDNCIIRNGAKIENSVIWKETIVGSHAKINSSIIGSFCNIQDDSIIEEDSIIANRSTITQSSTIRPHSRLTPGQRY